MIDKEKKKNEDNIEKNIINENERLYLTFFYENNYESLFKYKSSQIKYNKNNISKKSSKSIKNFLTVDELFDINNH